MTGGCGLEFRVLGPLEIWRDDRRLDPGMRRQRLVLGVLLLDPGRTVRLDRLTELAWLGESQPRTARNAIQVCVSNLRALLGDIAPIVHSGGGYHINVDHASIDIHRFRGLVKESRDVELNHRIELLRRAGDMWRGPAFDGTFTDDLRRLVCGGIDEERTNAIERRIEAQLQVGQHAESIVELTDLAREHPTREHLVYLLMLALYRDGQAPRALELYRTFRASLAEDLGIDPGPELRELEIAILRRAAHLSPVPPASGPAGRVAPPVPSINQLPPATLHFVGRERELRLIVDRLASSSTTGPVTVAITGMGGLGKTSLAVRAARECLSAYPDGCLFVDLRGAGTEPVDPHATLGILLRSLGVEPARVPTDTEERVGLFRSVTAARRVLVVLDNVGSVAQARPMVPGGDGCGVIITSRQQMSALDGTHVPLGILSEAESRALLHLIVGGRLRKDPKAVQDLVCLSGGVPLAVRIVAARLATGTHSPRRLAAQLVGTVSRLDELTAGDLSVGASLMLSYRRLKPSAATLFRRLGISQLSDFTDWTCAVLLDDATDGYYARQELSDAHLAGPAHEDRFRLHDLVQLTAWTTARRAERREQHPPVLRRLVEAYLSTANGAVAAISYGRAPRYFTLSFTSPYEHRFTDCDPAMRWLTDECDNLVALIKIAAEADLPEYAWQLAHVLTRYLGRNHRIDEMLSIQGIGLAAARAHGAPRATAVMSVLVGYTYHTQVRYEAALAAYEEALAQATAAGDDLLAAYAETYVGRMRLVTGRVDLAEEHFRRALAVPAYADHTQEVAYTRLDIAIVHALRAGFDQAITEFEGVISAAAEFNDWNLACFAHHNFGDMWRVEGSLGKAEAHTRTGIEIAHRTGYTVREARGWEQLGAILELADKHRAAVDAWTRSAEIYDSLGDRRADGVRELLAASAGALAR